MFPVTKLYMIYHEKWIICYRQEQEDYESVLLAPYSFNVLSAEVRAVLGKSDSFVGKGYYFNLIQFKGNYS